MFRTLSAFILGLAVLAIAVAPAVAEKEEAKKDAPKEKEAPKGAVKLEGTITCPKCDLGTEDKCGTVIVVGKDKKTTYVFDAASNKKYHGEICKAAKEGKVEGTVKKDGDKLIITVTKLAFKE